MRAYCFRLHPGECLLEALTAFAKYKHIEAAILCTCVGSLSRWRLRSAHGEAIFEGHQQVEITSLTGTISAYGCHLHISLALGNLNTIGGHLLPGCTVSHTAEVVMLEMDGFAFHRAFDPDTGHDELVIGDYS